MSFWNRLTRKQAMKFAAFQPNGLETATRQQEPAGQQARVPYSIVKNEADNSAEVNMYGEVVSDRPKDFWTDETDDSMYIVEKEFLDDIDRLDSFDSVTFRINSVGGDADAGIAIFNRIRGMKAKTTTIVDGLAASAASIIYMAGDTRQVNVGSQIMVHGSSVGLLGYYNANDLKEMLKLVNGYDNSMIDIYTDRSGQSRESVARMVSNTTWLTAQEAVDKGFATELINATEPDAKKVNDRDDLIVVNGNPLHIAASLMPHLNFSGSVALNTVFSGTEPSKINTNSSLEKEDMMDFKDITLEDLKANRPDLVSAITETALTEEKQAIADAVDAERTRIQEIEEIEASVYDKELVNEAKYGEKKMSASELALAFMKAQAQQASDFLKAQAQDAADSGVADVTATPHADAATEKDQKADKDSVEALANAFKAQ